jgi:Asp-tRNA(Asn)/Glu-tRNA(Gln) amidotransferase A subunit family amidase
MLRQFLDWLEGGVKSPVEVWELCAKRIAEGDGALRAWVEVAPQPALAEGPLTGIPFGVKDTFETPGLSTAYGSAIFAGRKGTSEAPLVTEFRRRGAIMAGKTQTTPFASFDPSPTRNPWDAQRTPGGSSSGSAAAVAAGMVPFALGSQTQGSVLRPASYCGVTGFKPTFGRIPAEGILPFAPSLDTAGLFTRTAEDMQLLWARSFGSRACGTARQAAYFHLPVEAEMAQAIAQSVARLRAAGWQITEMDAPSGFDRLLEASRLINSFEGGRTHRQCWQQHGERMGHRLAQLIENGLRIPEGEYQAAREHVAAMRSVMDDSFREFPVVLTAAAPGIAPSADSTGDPRLNATWTALGTPAISVPMQAAGLPLGLQITSAWGRDDFLVSTAVEIEAMLR